MRLKTGAKSPSGIVINNNINLDSAKPKHKAKGKAYHLNQVQNQPPGPWWNVPPCKPVAVKQTIKQVQNNRPAMVKTYANAKPLRWSKH
jgi:hypothetical protein